ncbi:XRE family transcriptional regulator [Actinopolyspora erythraea]|uniref:DNA-binding protein n=2 Tax=Actinopolyspora erythraea TaxID=414996 RepID=A0A099D176_9ACTN|nr:XRE family transcriptional regulator [Actinopolyspora erythraea]KGI79819.1 DNA-binding protein [Actinopolyspora erythraea]
MAHSRPTIQRRQLGAELRRLREAASKSQKEAAEVIECDSSLLSRTERGERSLKIVELNALLELYEAPAAKREEIIQLGQLARQRQSRRMFSDALPGAFRRVSDHEREAREIQYSEPDLIPGLLQTEDYIRALMHAGRSAVSEADPDEIETHVQFRLERQELLTMSHPPVMWFVIGEAALRRPVRSKSILREQLLYLLKVIDEHQNVITQVAPLSIPDHPLLGGSIGIFRFDGTVPDIAHQSTFIGGGVYIDDEQDIAECAHAFDRLRAVALGPEDSRAFIAKRAKELDHEH